MLNYIDVGEGIPIVMIHGLGSHKGYWSPQFELSDTYRLIMVDLPGHGQSEYIGTNDISLNNMALAVIEVLEHLHIKEAYILGHSLGCSVAQEIYRQREDLVKGLILANGTFYVPVSVSNYVKEQSEKVFNEDRNLLIDLIIEKSLFDKDYYKQAKEKFYLSDTYLDYITVATGHNFFPTLLKLEKPLLLIGGTFDTVVPTINQVIMRWLVPKAEFELLEAGHLSSLECKGEFNELIRKFVD